MTADEQTAGRGRQGRTWSAAPGDALLMSLIVRELHPLLPLAAAVAVAEALEPIDATLKWPNDVWIDGRKAAGILLEGRPQEGWAVIGIGLNVRTREFPDDLRDTATSLALAGDDRSVAAAREDVVVALERWTGASSGDILEAWRRRDALRGRHISWNGGEGTAEGITDGGALLVETPTGAVVELDAGEVHLAL